jgi:Icc-related predicted phosphoesterase
MTEEKTISVYAIVHKEFCLSSDDGNEVFRRLSKVMGEGFVTILSFDKIKIMTSAFLNAAIGKLYGEFDEEKIQNHLRVEGADEGDMALIEHVKKFARLYYKDRESHQQLLDEI